MRGEGKIKLIWGLLILIGALITNFIGYSTNEIYAYAIPWIVLVLIGLFLTVRIPHEHRERDRVVGLVWLILAVIGIVMSVLIGDETIKTPLTAIPVVWMAIVGIGSILTAVIEKTRMLLIPGIVLLAIAPIAYAIADLHPYLFTLFGLGFGIPMIIVGLLEK